MPSSHHLRTQLHIRGMTCGSCEILLERKFKAVPGVLSVHVHHRKGTAFITADSDNLPSLEVIEDVIRTAGYALVDPSEPVQRESSHASSVNHHSRKWMEIGAALLILFALYKILQAFDVVSLAPSTSGAVSLGGIFIIGLVAGMSSCLAVTGGLLIALAAKHNEVRRAETPWQKFIPLLHFNIGRLVSYFVLGGLVSLLGNSITLSPWASGMMNIIVAFIMLWLALTILHIIPKGSFPLQPPKKLSRWIASLSESNHPLAPLALGAMTFFLPCGFTQSLQIVALNSGSFFGGAFTMFIFALGTLPALIGLSTLSSVATGAFSQVFLRFSGTLVLLLALLSFQSGLALTGIDFSTILPSGGAQAETAPSITGGVQEVKMKVMSYGAYEPKHLTIKAGVPVRWIVDGTEAGGCTSTLVIPSLGVSKTLSSGTNVIAFTAQKKGTLPFSCSMGMVRGSFTVI